MSKNVESHSRTITGQTETVHEVDSYVETLQKCKVSKNTAGLLSCILLLYDLYDKVFVELNEMYGAYGIALLRRALLYGFVNDSIGENIMGINLKQI